MSEPEPRIRPRRRPIVLAAVAVAALAATAAVYEMTGRAGNVGAGECTAAAAKAERLKPLAQGEVAAVQVASQPSLLPDISFLDGQGAERRLSDWRGRTVLVNLWATWCAPCRYEMPALDNLEAQLGGSAFEVVAVNIDTGDGAKPRNFLDEIGIESLAYYADPTTGVFRELREVGRAVGMPTTLIVDEDGCELGYLAGPAEWDSEDALALIRAALAEE